MSFQTNLTQDQILSNLDALRLAALAGVLRVTFSDGKSQEFQSTDAIKKAISMGEDWLNQMSGQPGVRCSFGQTKRGDGPHGSGHRW